MNFLYLQRGKFRQTPLESKSGVDKLADWDYMGSSEFEFGALGKSLKKIRKGQYEFSRIMVKGVPLVIVHKVGLLRPIQNAIEEMIAGNMRYAEYPYFMEHWDSDSALRDPEWGKRFNIWWEIFEDFVIILDTDETMSDTLANVFIEGTPSS